MCDNVDSKKIDWTEIIDEIRGSQQWYKGIIYICHLCEEIFLDGQIEPVEIGTGDESEYSKPPPITHETPTILIERNMLTEPSHDELQFKLGLLAFGTVLAHEMSHHVLACSVEFEENSELFFSIPTSVRKQVLNTLDAYYIAKISGSSLLNIDYHWAETEANAKSRCVADFSDKIEKNLLHDPEMPPLDKGDITIQEDAKTSSVNEWTAAVHGFLMYHRFRRGPAYVRKLVASFEGIDKWGSNKIIRDTLLIPARNDETEKIAEQLANKTLQISYSNDALDEINQNLNTAEKSWDSIPGAKLILAPSRKLSK